MLYEPVPEGDQSHPCWRLGRRVLSQDKVDRLLEQRLGAHPADDPAQQRRGRQDAHLRAGGGEQKSRHKNQTPAD